MTYPLDPLDPLVWKTTKSVFHRARASSLHCAIASIDLDGSPHVTPIGSVLLGDPGSAVYFDAYNVGLGRNLDRDPHCTILAVDSSKASWLRALLRGRFDTAPGVRLIGTVSPARPATSAELDRFRRAVRPALRTRGGRLLWGHPERFRARDVTITGVQPVRISTMTRCLWATETTETAETAEMVRSPLR
jgi:hypothetical protein